MASVDEELAASIKRTLANMAEPSEEELFANGAPPDQGLDISVALLRVLTKRFGSDLAAEVRAEITTNADRLAALGTPRGAAHAAAIREATLDDPIWEELGLTVPPAAS